MNMISRRISRPIVTKRPHKIELRKFVTEFQPRFNALISETVSATKPFLEIDIQSPRINKRKQRHKLEIDLPTQKF